jgi:uncharacterized protein (TIGR02246 family)
MHIHLIGRKPSENDRRAQRLGEKMKALIAAGLLVLISASLVHTRATTGNQDVEPVRKASAQAYGRWVAATKRKDAQAVIELYAEEAIVLPPGGEPIRGRQAILAFYKKYYSGGWQLLNEEFKSTSLVLRGDLAIETAEYTGEIEAGEKGRTFFKGKNLVVWKQQKDGSWKLLRDMWSSSSPQ